MLVFEEHTHTYTLDGEVVPSVTGILKATGIIDFTGIPAGVLESARTRGTTVHAAVHYFNEGDLDVDGFYRDFPEYAPYLRAWVSFCEQRRFRAVLNEHRVASRKHRVAGTLDCLGWLDDRAVLLDFATGRPQDVSKDLQTAAYHALATEWAEEGDEALQSFLFSARGVVHRYAVSLRRDGTFSLEQYASPRDYREFLLLTDAHRIVTTRRAERGLCDLVAV